MNENLHIGDYVVYSSRGYRYNLFKNRIARIEYIYDYYEGDDDSGGVGIRWIDNKTVTTVVSLEVLDKIDKSLLPFI